MALPFAMCQLSMGVQDKDILPVENNASEWPLTYGGQFRADVERHAILRSFLYQRENWEFKIDKNLTGRRGGIS